ncbi:hypothetical protein [Micromonospora sp. CA-111912]
MLVEPLRMLLGTDPLGATVAVVAAATVVRDQWPRVRARWP